MEKAYWSSQNPYWKPARLSEINHNCKTLWEELLCHKDVYGLSAEVFHGGATALDCGLNTLGSLEAGRIITELCQGGLAKASLSLMEIGGITLPQLVCSHFQAAATCMDMQMGIPFHNAILSGPYRLFVEPLRFVTDDIALSEAMDSAIVLMEPHAGINEITNEDAIELAKMGNIDPKDLKIVIVPGASLAGSTQVSGRAGENVLLTIHRSLLIDSTKVINAVGSAPICPIYNGSIGEMRLDCDDFLHYASQVYVAYYSEPGEDVQRLAENLVFENLDINGTYWADIMDAVGGDFFQIPNITDLNRVGKVTINDLRTGQLYKAGNVNYDIIINRLLKS